MDEDKVVVVKNGGSGAGWLIGIVLLVALVVGFYFAFGANHSQSAKDQAITNAANSVGNAADQVSTAVKKNTR